MKINLVINPVWKNLSEKLFRSFFEKHRAHSSGTNLILENSTGDDLINLIISGNSEQNVTLPNPSWPVPIENVGEAIVCNQVIDKSTFVQTKSDSGITFTSNGDGSITVNGTATGWSDFILKIDFTFLEGHKYLFAGVEDIADHVQFYLYGDEGYPNNAVCNGIFTIPAEWVIAEVCLRVMKNSVVENAVYKPQIFDLTEMFGAGNEPETVEAFREIFPDDYYEFGANVTKYAIPVKVSGKNLINYALAVVRIRDETVTVESGTVTWNGTYYFAIPCRLPKGTYTATYQSSVAGSWGVRYADGTFGYASSSGSALQFTQDVVNINIYKTNPTIRAENMVFINIQLELGSTATEYEPYHEPVTKTIYLDEPLRKGDTLEVVGGTRVKRRALLDLGSLNWTMPLDYFRATVINTMKPFSSGFCELFPVKSTALNANPNKTLVIDGDSRVFVRDPDYSTAEEFKAAMSGVILEYELAAPITTNLEGQTIPTFEGTTIITVDTDPEPETMTAVYWRND